MKAIQLVLGTLALAIGGSVLLCHIGELALGDSAKYIVLPLALFLGLSARRIVEKFLGYTLLEALRENSNDEQK